MDKNRMDAIRVKLESDTHYDSGDMLDDLRALMTVPDPDTDTFQLRIDLGNDAMWTNEDIIGALQGVIKKLTTGSEAGKVKDANGNTVGSYELNRTEQPEDDDDQDEGIEAEMHAGADEPEPGE